MVNGVKRSGQATGGGLGCMVPTFQWEVRGETTRNL
jgi:hypothetical protein